MDFLIIIIALVVLHASTELLIASCERLAGHLQLPAWVMSGLLLSLGTSLPEVMVSISSSLAGLQQLALSNVIGSNMANITLAFSLPWLIFSFKAQQITRLLVIEFVLMQVLLAFILVFYQLNIVTGILLLSAFILSMMIKIKGYKSSSSSKDKIKIVDIFLLVLAIILVPLASHFTVVAAEGIIRSTGISELFFGVVFLAIGTSLPEVVATGVAFKSKKYNIGLANILGSNIINSTLVTSIIGFVGGYHLTDSREFYNIALMLVLSFVMVGILLFKKSHKGFAAAMLAMYLAYLFVCL